MHDSRNQSFDARHTTVCSIADDAPFSSTCFISVMQVISPCVLRVDTQFVLPSKSDRPSSSCVVLAVSITFDVARHVRCCACVARAEGSYTDAVQQWRSRTTSHRLSPDLPSWPKVVCSIPTYAALVTRF